MDGVRGVNLGGWLVLERWISPSVFAGTEAKDEYSLCQQLGPQEAARRLMRHRDTFITEDHIRQIAELGLNTVRVPIGYWLFGRQQPFVDGANRYVERLFAWADECRLKIILDFHAAPGSQNGHDHSGRAGKVGWHTDEAHIEASLAFIKRLAARYGREPALRGIELLNEPNWEAGPSQLLDYYQRATRAVRAHCHQSVAIIVSDAYRPKEMSKALRRAKLNDVTLDVHLYQLFTPEDRALDLNGHLRKVDKVWNKELKKLRRHHDVLVGEWSAAMHELYRPTDQPARHYTNEDYRAYCAAQQRVFDKHGVSWTYWTVRTEGGGIWSLLNHPKLLG